MMLWLCTSAHWLNGPSAVFVACSLCRDVLRRGNPEALSTGDYQLLARIINVLWQGLISGSFQRGQLNHTFCNCSVEKRRRQRLVSDVRSLPFSLMCTCLPYLRSHMGVGLHSALIPTLLHFEGLSTIGLYRGLQVNCRRSFSLYSSACWRAWPFSITGGGHFSSAGENKSWYHEQNQGLDWSKVNLWLCGLNPSSGHRCSRGFGLIQESTERLLDGRNALLLWNCLSAHHPFLSAGLTDAFRGSSAPLSLFVAVDLGGPVQDVRLVFAAESKNVAISCFFWVTVHHHVFVHINERTLLG